MKWNRNWNWIGLAIMVILVFLVFLYEPIKNTIELERNPIEEMSCDELNEKLIEEDNILWANYIANIMILKNCELRR